MTFFGWVQSPTSPTLTRPPTLRRTPPSPCLRRARGPVSRAVSVQPTAPPQGSPPPERRPLLSPLVPGPCSGPPGRRREGYSGCFTELHRQHSTTTAPWDSACLAPRHGSSCHPLACMGQGSITPTSQAKGRHPLSPTAGGGWHWHLCLFARRRMPTTGFRRLLEPGCVEGGRSKKKPMRTRGREGAPARTYRDADLPQDLFGDSLGFFQHLVQGATVLGAAQEREAELP